MPPSIMPSICPKNEGIAASVELALFTLLLLHTKYINLLHVTSFSILGR